VNNLDGPDTRHRFGGAGIAAALIICAAVGALFGGVVALLIAPVLAPALMIGFAMSFAAGGVAWVLVKTTRTNHQPDERAAHTEARKT
jgi:ribose/xylose/arabinose/galactoside ABC-type transport system permease subunit